MHLDCGVDTFTDMLGLFGGFVALVLVLLRTIVRFKAVLDVITDIIRVWVMILSCRGEHHKPRWRSWRNNILLFYYRDWFSKARI
jgi:hypothetical protein